MPLKPLSPHRSAASSVLAAYAPSSVEIIIVPSGVRPSLVPTQQPQAHAPVTPPTAEDCALHVAMWPRRRSAVSGIRVATATAPLVPPAVPQANTAAAERAPRVVATATAPPVECARPGSVCRCSNTAVPVTTPRSSRFAIRFSVVMGISQRSAATRVWIMAVGAPARVLAASVRSAPSCVNKRGKSRGYQQRLRRLQATIPTRCCRSSELKSAG
jgi:hypothetical protein